MKRWWMVCLLGGALFVLIWGDFRPVFAQYVICCNEMIDVGGKWIGASRVCDLTGVPPEKLADICKQIRAAGPLCPAVEKFCKACSGRDGEDAYAPDDPIVQQLIDGFRAHGIDIGPEHILVYEDKKKEFTRFVVRLDNYGCVLPDGQCVMEAGRSGAIPKGKQEGAKHHMYGGVKKYGTITRVWSRVVRVETGVILRAGKADATGENAIAKATTQALANMTMTCKEVRGLIY